MFIINIKQYSLYRVSPHYSIRLYLISYTVLSNSFFLFKGLKIHQFIIVIVISL